MVIERTVKTIENGINKIIEEIETLENFSNELSNVTAIGAVQGQLDTLKRIELLRDALIYLGINSYEYRGNKIGHIFNILRTYFKIKILIRS